MDDAIAGCLMGCVVGDSLGCPHEMRFHRNNVYEGILYINPQFHYRYCSWKNEIGQYSDDTEMTLCTVRAIIATNGVYSKKATIDKYQEWASTSRSMGINTRALFKGVKTLKGYQKRYDKLYKDTDQNTWSQSNGSLMRCSILSFFGDASIIDCKLSNPHKVNIDSNKLYSFLIRSSAYKLSRRKTINGIKKLDICDIVMDIFNEAISSPIPTRDVTIKKGWVLHALYCAIWAWFYAESYQESIDTIIRMGGDTDTNAAIAGALIGAKIGLEAMLDEDRTFTNIFTVLNMDCSEGDNPRPKWLTLHDFFDVVKELTKLVEAQ